MEVGERGRGVGDIRRKDERRRSVKQGVTQGGDGRGVGRRSVEKGERWAFVVRGGRAARARARRREDRGGERQRAAAHDGDQVDGGSGGAHGGGVAAVAEERSLSRGAVGHDGLRASEGRWADGGRGAVVDRSGRQGEEEREWGGLCNGRE